MTEKLDLIAATKARALLMILVATCRETLLALEAADNILDVDMTDELRRMIARTEAEVKALTEHIQREV